jgi:general secretion pathway protein K
MTPRRVPGSRDPSRRDSARPQAGIALVLALWLTVLLTVIASGFAFSMRTEAMAARNALSLARVRAAAAGGIERAAYELGRPRLPGAWTPDGALHTWQEDDITLRVVAVDEAARIDLNVASEALLRSMFASVGVDPDRAVHLAQAIEDWRDPDDLKRPNGAEEADYRQAGLAYTPGNGPFETVADVARVLGMTGDVYDRIAPLVTVHSRQAGVNPGTASREVLLALPNVTAEAVDAFIAQRDAARDAGRSPPPFPPAQAFLSGAVPVWRIAAEASLPDGVTFAREAVLRPSADPQRPLIALAWLELPRLRALAAPAGAPAAATSAAKTTDAAFVVPLLR